MSSVFTDDSSPVMSFPGLSVRTSCVGLVQGMSSSASAQLERDPAQDLDTDSESMNGATMCARSKAGSTSRPILRSEESGALPALHIAEMKCFCHVPECRCLNFF